jgi:conjugal transfer pilus assembly protein TraW
LKLLPILALTCATALPLHAKNMGVQGNVWPIIEVDMRQLMIESAARADWSAAQDQATNSAKRYLETLPKRTFPTSAKTVTAWVNPSVTVSSDIQVPVKNAKGAYEWQVLAPKGSSYNPLTTVRPATAFILFDGADEAQVKFVQAALAQEPNRLVPVEAGRGDLGTNNKTFGRPVFYASDAMLNRFRVQYLPSVVYPGSGAQELLLGVTSFAAPFRPAELLGTWPGVQGSAPSLSIKNK